MPLFNDLDVGFMVDRFGLDGLRQERARAESHLHVALYLDNDAEAAFFEEYLEVINTAIKLIRSKMPKPKPIDGKLSIQEIKEHSDIVEVAERYTKLKKAGANFKGSCPLHSDNSPSMVIYPGEQRWWCFQCNQGGDVFDLVEKVEHCDIKQAAAILRG